LTIRRHPITEEPIIYAPERASRPNAFARGERLDRCPFCPGHEEDTPPEIARVTLAGAWTARAFPNKFPAVAGHEVIVDSPAHDAAFDAISDPAAVVTLWIDRVRDALARHEYVSLFKNHGTAAGASIAHIHSQIMPLTFLPPRVSREKEAFLAADVCPLCKLARESAEDEVIEETDHFVRLAPPASSFAYQQWIVPRRHQSGILDLAPVEIADLARILGAASRGMLTLADAYNWMFMIFPGTEQAHFYVEAFPRLTRVAGFELGTGTFIDIIDPAAAARHYRSH
jgi:UDPglucose--hexose-1-phosphate uridylyltransferase